MAITYTYEYTDTFCGEPNYAWVRRGTIEMPELTFYGYDGATNYTKANCRAMRHLIRKVKAKLGLNGVRGTSHELGDSIVWQPFGKATILTITAE